MRLALSDLEIVLARSPEHLDALVARALTGIEDESADPLPDRAVTLAPHFAEAFIGRGMRRVFTDPVAARQDAEHAYRISRGSANSIALSAIIELRTGNLDAARSRLAGLSQAPPSLIAITWTGYGQVLFARGHEAEARQAVDRALEARPTHVDALALRAMLRMGADDHDGARRNAPQALARDPTT
jgi:tetratricopeptide (TPR) repeat protein